MINALKWKPSKFQVKSGKLLPSVSKYASSYRMASYIATFYNFSIPKYAKGALLDLGCGNVPMYAFYKSNVEEITCVDWDNSLHDIKYLDLSCDLNTILPLQSNSFDTVICSDVIEHLVQPLILFSEINRVLKPGGYLLLNYPFLYGIHEAPHDHQRYTEFFIRKIANDFSMDVIHCFAYGNLLDMFEHSSIRILKQIRFTKPMQILVLGIIMPIFRKILNSKLYQKNHHPYMYGFIIRKSFSC